MFCGVNLLSYLCIYRSDNAVTYIDVIIPLPLPGYFTYRIPGTWEGQVKEGSRVIVPFGPRKLYAAFVVRLYHDEPSAGFEVKEAAALLDAKPLLLPGQTDFWQWMAGYYMCTVGDVCKAALPSGLKLESESCVERNGEWQEDGEAMTETEQMIWNCLADGKACSVADLVRRSGAKVRVHAALRTLLERGAVRMKENVRFSYKPRIEWHVRLCEPYRSPRSLSRLFDVLKRAPKQLDMLLKYVEMSGLSEAWSRNDEKLIKEVARRRLTCASASDESAFSALRARGVVEIYPYEVERRSGGTLSCRSESPLSGPQQQAFDDILSCFRDKQVCLLHGVTSSGKTEVYMHLIRRELDAGRQVLYLLPEIALTTQVTERLRSVFGSQMGVYHSRFPDAERVEMWYKQLSDNPYGLVLGARSALFLPFRRLGLIIVDEEHEASYKQQDPAPRYHARDAAIVLAARCGARTLLGTATPSLESYTNAQNGKYGLATLLTRYGNVCLPEVHVENVAELRRKKIMKSPFSPRLIDAVNQALAQKEQVILFQNRRGYAPFLECRTCGWVPRCKHCDVSLVYHHAARRLVCHYCGTQYPVPAQCPNCGGTDLRDKGYGTEKIEDAVRTCFPAARTARMDMDTTQSRLAYERILADFQQGQTDILIGTQMVSKGLDFDRVRVVGILDADTSLNIPDFRSHERAFQLMDQVAGRAGRRSRQGVVILQTRQPDLPIISQVVTHDYQSFYSEQMSERKLFGYPPFCRIIYIYLKHRDQETVDEAARVMAVTLRTTLGNRLLGPDAPPVARHHSLHIRKMVLKMENSASVAAVRRCLDFARRQMQTDVRFRSVQVYYDVDPL